MLQLDGFDIDELKTAPINLKKLSDVVKNEVVKNKNFKKIRKKVNNLEN